MWLTESLPQQAVENEHQQIVADFLERRIAGAILGWASNFQYQEGGEGEDAYTVGDYVHNLCGFDDPLNFVEVPLDTNELAGEVIALVYGGAGERAVTTGGVV